MTKLIERDYLSNVFLFRGDGYFNMTRAAKLFGKRIDHFLDNADTTDYLEALKELVPGIPLIKDQKGNGSFPTVGTWGHPKLAVFFARWLDVKFAVFCDMVIDDILYKKVELTTTKPDESLAMKVPKTYLEMRKELVGAVKAQEAMEQESLQLALEKQEMAHGVIALDY